MTDNHRREAGERQVRGRVRPPRECRRLSRVLMVGAHVVPRARTEHRFDAFNHLADSIRDGTSSLSLHYKCEW